MICNNCNKLNEEGNKFCKYCGSKLDSANVNNQIISINNSENKGKKSFLPWISLGLMLLKLFLIVLTAFFPDVRILLYLNFIPLLIGSLILSIISRVINKDKLSLLIMIVDIILIVVLFIFVVCYLNFIIKKEIFSYSSDLNSCGNDGTDLLFGMCEVAGR